MNSRRTHRNQAGYSLVEALAAVALLAVGTLAVVPMQRAAIRGNHTTFTDQVAVSLATQLLERSRVLPYKDARLAETSGFVVPSSTLSAPNPLAESGETGGLFERTWRIEADEPIDNLKRISVRVAWNEGGKRREMTIATLRTR